MGTSELHEINLARISSPTRQTWLPIEAFRQFPFFIVLSIMQHDTAGLESMWGPDERQITTIGRVARLDFRGCCAGDGVHCAALHLHFGNVASASNVGIGRRSRLKRNHARIRRPRKPSDREGATNQFPYRTLAFVVRGDQIERLIGRIFIDNAKVRLQTLGSLHLRALRRRTKRDPLAVGRQMIVAQFAFHVSQPFSFTAIHRNSENIVFSAPIRNEINKGAIRRKFRGLGALLAAR